MRRDLYLLFPLKFIGDYLKFDNLHYRVNEKSDLDCISI